MPESITFKVTSYYKLAKDETGLTQTDTRRITAVQALDWILGDIEEAADDENSVTVKHENDVLTIMIDWSKVPESIKNPKIPAPRRR